MTDTTVPLASEVAREILSTGIILNWPYFLLLLAISFVGGAAGSFLWAYFRKRGEALATKADFEEVLAQVKRSTRAAEEAKAEVSEAFGEAAARKVIIREKIEALFSASHALLNWHKRAFGAASRGSTTDEASPLDELEMLQELYFPEARAEMSMVSEASRNLVWWMADVVEQKALSTLEHRQQPRVPMEQYKPLIEALIGSLANVRGKVLVSYAPRAGL